MTWRLGALAALVVVAGCKQPGDSVSAEAKADGHYLVGTSAFLKGDFAAAHAAFGEVRKLKPDDPRLPAAEGELALAEGNLTEATRLFEEAARREPRRATNFSRLGYLYVLQGQAEKARPALDKAIDLNPHDFNALEAYGDLEVKGGTLDEAVIRYMAAAEAASGGDRGDLVLKATAALTRAGQGARAPALLEDALKRGIESAALWSELGDVRVSAGDLPAALEAYEKAAALDPKDPTLWELAGEVALKLGRLDDAEADFKRSLEVADRSVVHVALARLCRQRKDAACVAAQLDAALEKASGEELREATDLAELLAAVGRKKDALLLLKGVSEEADQRLNVPLQLETARLAKELKDTATLEAACARALAQADAGVTCP